MFTAVSVSVSPLSDGYRQVRYSRNESETMNNSKCFLCDRNHFYDQCLLTRECESNERVIVVGGNFTRSLARWIVNFFG